MSSLMQGKNILLQRLQHTVIHHLSNQRRILNRIINQNRITSRSRGTNQSLVINRSPNTNPITIRNQNLPISHDLTTSLNQLLTKPSLIISQSQNHLKAQNRLTTPPPQHL